MATGMSAASALIHLNPSERGCVRHFISTVAEQLDDNLVEIWLFGSAARGDM
jgi:predicted nucleotidyltransferase